jgi:adenine-specific DNA-methyltransferase
MRTSKPKSIWIGSQYSTDAGTKSLRELISGTFDITPKAVGFIKAILQHATEGSEDEIVLDFFAGSCTTAQAVLELNREDGGQRRFILLQIPERIENPQFSTIAELGKERIRRVIIKMQKNQSGQLPLDTREKPEDIGFKVFNFYQSNFKNWKPYTGSNAMQLGTLFDQFESPLVGDWKPENLLTEIILLQGFPLDSRIRLLPAYKKNTVNEVSSEFCQHRLYVCLDPKVLPETVSALRLRPEDILVCLDSALSDEAKIQMSDQCNLRVI